MVDTYTTPSQETKITSIDTITVWSVIAGANDSTKIGRSQISIRNKGVADNTITLIKTSADGGTVLAEVSEFTLEPEGEWHNPMGINLNGVDEILRVTTTSTSAIDVMVNPSSKKVVT
jgi:hypothetical protein